jgi:hypothetical protein
MARSLGVSDATVLRWCDAGLLPDQPARPGSGRHRSFTDADVRVARGLAVVSRAMRPTLPFREVIGPAVRDAALRGETEVRLEVAPGFVVSISWAEDPDVETSPRADVPTS